MTKNQNQNEMQTESTGAMIVRLRNALITMSESNHAELTPIANLLLASMGAALKMQSALQFEKQQYEEKAYEYLTEGTKQLIDYLGTEAREQTAAFLEPLFVLASPQS